MELLTAAFGLVAALAWNTAIQALFAAISPEAEEPLARFLYATVVTIIVVVVAIRMGRLAQQIKEHEWRG